MHGKNAANCKRTNFSIAKTIRVHSNRLEGWLENEEDLLVLHLVRDPRDQYISRRAPNIAHDFKCVSKNISAYCDVMQADMDYLLKMPDTRVRRLRYEDLVSDPSKVVEDVYSWVGVPFTSEVKQVVLKLLPPWRPIKRLV